MKTFTIMRNCCNLLNAGLADRLLRSEGSYTSQCAYCALGRRKARYSKRTQLVERDEIKRGTLIQSCEYQWLARLERPDRINNWWQLQLRGLRISENDSKQHTSKPLLIQYGR